MKVVKTGEEIRKEALEKKHTEVGQSPVTSTQNPYESAKKKIQRENVDRRKMEEKIVGWSTVEIPGNDKLVGPLFDPVPTGQQLWHRCTFKIHGAVPGILHLHLHPPPSACNRYPLILTQPLIRNVYRVTGPFLTHLLAGWQNFSDESISIASSNVLPSLSSLCSTSLPQFRVQDSWTGPNHVENFIGNISPTPLVKNSRNI